MTVWYDNPIVLIDPKKLLQFWPTSEQTPSERVNSTTRFIVYASALLYFIKRDIRIVALGAIVLAVLYVFYRNGQMQPQLVI